jgi:sRNA-binding carbon storage regulator CsrA
MTAVAKQLQSLTSRFRGSERGSWLGARVFYCLAVALRSTGALAIELSSAVSGSPKVLQKARGGQMRMMTRRVNESLVIGSDIHVTVLDIRENCVRLAISSPEAFPQYWEQTLYWNPAQEDRLEEDQVEQEAAEPLLLQ